jgi:DNA helicase-2/ATP-dependent DNA helicase PcrA
MVEALAQRDRITFASALERAADAPGIASRSVNAIEAFVAMLASLRTLVESGSPPTVVLQAVLEQSGYLAELAASDDPQDETRVENLAELQSVAADFEHDNPEGSLADFLERVSLVADSDEIRGCHADDVAYREGAGVPGRVPHRRRGWCLPPYPGTR